MKISRFNRMFNIFHLRHISYKSILLFAVLLMIPLFFATKAVITVFTQTKNKDEKKVTKRFAPNEPIEIVNLGNSQKSFRLDEKIKQDKDWLKDFTIEVKNKSDKAISYMRIELDFPETASSGNIIAFPISYGVRPSLRVRDEKTEMVESGKNIKLTLNEKQFGTLKSFIEKRQSLDNISEISIRIVFVLFDDGTGWSAGTFVRPDPTNPKRFIPIDPKSPGGN